MDELSMAGSAAVDEESKAVYVAASAAPWFHHPRRSLLPCGVLRPSPSWYQEQSLLQVSCNNEVRQKSPFLSYDRFAAAWTKCRIRVFPPSHLKVHPLQQYIWEWTSFSDIRRPFWSFSWVSYRLGSFDMDRSRIHNNDTSWRKGATVARRLRAADGMLGMPVALSVKHRDRFFLLRGFLSSWVRTLIKSSWMVKWRPLQPSFQSQQAVQRPGMHFVYVGCDVPSKWASHLLLLMAKRTIFDKLKNETVRCRHWRKWQSAER